MNMALILGGAAGMFCLLSGDLLLALFVWFVGLMVGAFCTFLAWLAAPGRGPVPDKLYDPDTYYVEGEKS